jgi:hypothetical protein
MRFPRNLNLVTARVEDDRASAAREMSPSNPTTPTPEEVGAEALDLAFWNSVTGSGRREEFQAYLEQHPNGHLPDSPARRRQLSELIRMARVTLAELKERR